MEAGSLLSRLREKRAARDLSQAALAERVGVSRQAIVAIEAGKQVPSTELALLLARELHCSVEELFELSLPQALVLPYSERAPGGRSVLGCVDDRWVLHPLASGSDGGDAIFSQLEDKQARVEPLFALHELEQNVLVAGCAPLIGVLGDSWARGAGSGRATWISTSSSRALDLLEDGEVHVAGVHLVSTDEPQGHAGVVQEKFGARAMTVMNLTRFRQGLIVQRGNPRGIHCVADFLRQDLRSVQRQEGAGAQLLLRRLLSERGHCLEEVPRGPIARGHWELASWVRHGLVDLGIAIEPVALAEGLDFIPLSEERFDLVLPQHRLEQRPVQRFLEQIESRPFRTEAAHLPGYDMTTSGQAATVSS